jgi:hypothetical protein
MATGVIAQLMPKFYRVKTRTAKAADRRVLIGRLGSNTVTRLTTEIPRQPLFSTFKLSVSQEDRQRLSPAQS